MQIAGNKCRACGNNITLSSEGKFCARCGTFAHLACAPQSACEVCGQPFECYEAPKPEPLRDAILPRALRPAKSGGPVIAAGLILLLAFLFFILYYGFMQMLASGH